METNGAKSKPHVFKRIMNLSDTQLNVIYLQRIEEFEKNPFDDASEYSNCKTLARVFPRSVSSHLKFRQKLLCSW